MEQTPHLSQAFQQSLINSAIDAVIAIDDTGRIFEWNTAAEQTFGYSKQDAIGHAMSELIVPATMRAAHHAGMERYLQTHIGHILDTRVEIDAMHADGHSFPVELTVHAFSFEHREYFVAHVRDLTEQRKTAKELERLKIFYEAVLGSMPAALAVFDTEGRYLYVTPSAISDEKVRTWIEGKTDIDYCELRGIDVAVGERRVSALREVARTGVAKRFEEAFSGKDGQLRHFVRFVSPVVDEGGTVIQVLGYGLEISEVKRAEDALRLRASRLSALIENFHDGILVEDENRRIVNVNQQFCEIFGITVSPEHLVGADCVEASRQSGPMFADPASFFGRIDDVLERGELVLGDVLECKDSRILERDYVPIMVDGSYRGHLWLYRDITEQQRIQEILETAASLPRENPNPVLRIHNDGTLLYANNASAMLRARWGANPGEEVPPYWRDIVRSVIREGLRREVETTIDDDTYLVTLAPVQQADYANIYAMKITERKMMESELRRAKNSAEETDRAKSQFLAMVSHEIRTPMNGVIGAADILARMQLQADQREYIDIIRSSGDLLLAIVNDVLDLSKIEAGKLETTSMAFSLRECVSEATSLIAPLASTKGLAFGAVLKESVPESIVSDKQRLRQVLVNLLGNGVKFTEQGEVQVTVDVVAEDDEHWMLRFKIRDTGPGIPEERIDDLFKPFTQINLTTAGRYAGTGLGLSISERLITLLGGTIRAESRMGEGSVFIFTIRAEKPRAALLQDALRPERTTTGPGTGDALDILVAEDNEVNRIIVSRMLEELGHAPAFAVNGEEAVRMAMAASFDLILMDVQMPLLDGLAATRAIRTGRSADEQPVIVALTAHAITEEHERCLESGMDECLSKPLRLVDLEELLDRRLEELRAHRRTPAPRGSARPEVPPVDHAATAVETVPADTPEKATLLDANVLNMLAELPNSGEGDILTELVTLVDSHATELFMQWDTDETIDLQKLKRDVHRFAGSAATIGLKKVHEQCITIEGIESASSENTIREALAELRHEYRRSLALLREQYGQT